MDKQNKEIEISKPRMVKSHDVITTESRGQRYMIHQHKV